MNIRIFIQHRLWADVFQMPPHRQCFNVGGNLSKTKSMKSTNCRFSIALIFLFTITSCLNNLHEKKIEISPHYLLNENWEENESFNHLSINKMRLKKGGIINLANAGQLELLDNLENDSSFEYTANIKLNASDKKNRYTIYFNKDNGFYWWTDKGERRTKIIGNLEKGTWYKFSGLSYANCIYTYIFIDSLNKTHEAEVNLCNY